MPPTATPDGGPAPSRQPTAVHNSTSVPSGQRTLATVWPQGLVVGGVSRVAPAATARWQAGGTSSVTRPTYMPSGRALVHAST